MALSPRPRPRNNHTCNQKPNPSCETVPVCLSASLSSAPIFQLYSLNFPPFYHCKRRRQPVLANKNQHLHCYYFRKCSSSFVNSCSCRSPPATVSVGAVSLAGRNRERTMMTHKCCRYSNRAIQQLIKKFGKHLLFEEFFYMIDNKFSP